MLTASASKLTHPSPITALPTCALRPRDHLSREYAAPRLQANSLTVSQCPARATAYPYYRVTLASKVALK